MKQCDTFVWHLKGLFHSEEYDHFYVFLGSDEDLIFLGQLLWVLKWFAKEKFDILYNKTL